MRWVLSSMMLFVAANSGFAEEFQLIKSGKDYRSYTYQELQRRVWDLEIAVTQMQRRLSELESGQSGPNPYPDEPSWICTIKAPFNQLFTATGATMASAKSKVMEKCKAETYSDSRCAEVQCEH